MHFGKVHLCNIFCVFRSVYLQLPQFVNGEAKIKEIIRLQSIFILRSFFFLLGDFSIFFIVHLLFELQTIKWICKFSLQIYYMNYRKIFLNQTICKFIQLHQMNLFKMDIKFVQSFFMLHYYLTSFYGVNRRFTLFLLVILCLLFKQLYNRIFKSPYVYASHYASSIAFYGKFFVIERSPLYLHIIKILQYVRRFMHNE